MRAQVNQKLYFARLTLDQVQRIPSEDAAHTALLQAAVFHLVSAYRCFLREIAGNYRLSIDADDARAAQRLLSDHAIAEFAELAELERGRDWLTELLNAYERISKPASEAVVVRTANIPLTDISESMTFAACQGWLMSLRQWVEKQRERSQEW